MLPTEGNDRTILDFPLSKSDHSPLDRQSVKTSNADKSYILCLFGISKHNWQHICVLFYLVLEILQLVTKRDLFLADTHILELEQECADLAASSVASQPAGGALPEDITSPGAKDSGRRKAKDVELLYEALKKEMWEVVQQALHSPTAGPNLGLVVQVLEQEEQVDRTWASSEQTAVGGPRPRQMIQQWREAVAQAADSCLPPVGEVQSEQLSVYLDKIKSRMLEDLKAAWLNVVPIYPKEYDPLRVYVQSYHQAVTCRLQSIADSQLHIKDIYSLLDWIYNIYNRSVATGNRQLSETL